MKKVLAFYVLVCLSALVSLAFADQPAAPDKDVTMAYGKKKVIFSHAVHSSYPCVECHHENGERQFLPCQTEGCHPSTDRKEKGSFFQIMHARQGTKISTCVSCHASLNVDEARKKDLTSCTGLCHPKV